MLILDNFEKCNYQQKIHCVLSTFQDVLFYYQDISFKFFLLLCHFFHNTLRTYKIKLRHFQKQDSTFMQDKRLLWMLRIHLDILRYVFIIGGWFENWTNRTNHRIKISQMKIHIQFTRYVNKNQYFRNNENVIIIDY